MFIYYLHLGFQHVVPMGYDHLLFMACLFFSSTGIKQKMILCSVFTLAHSASLALAFLGYVSVPSSFVEPLIAVSIFVTAIQNISGNTRSSVSMFFVFIFGLIHGLGFANALQQLGGTSATLMVQLLGFNAGVEVAQISFLIGMYLVIEKPFIRREWYIKKMVNPSNIIIACIALFWTFQRLGWW